MKLLLQNNAKVDGTDKNGASALIYASTFGHRTCVETLLAFGANAEHESDQG